MKHMLDWPTYRRPLILAMIYAALLLGVAVASASASRARAVAVSADAGGVISSDTAWTSAITVTSPVTVTSGATLTIAPGVEVRFAPGTWLRVEGGLNAQGTHARQIRMIPVVNAAGDTPWQGLIAAQQTAKIRLRSVSIAQAAAGLAIEQTGASPPPGAPPRIEVLDSLFYSNTIAIAANYTGATGNTMLALRNNLLTHNSTGMQLLGLANNSKIKLNHNSFVGNDIGLKTTGQGQLRARQQWWGSAAGPLVGDPATCAATPTPGAGDIVCGPVDFTPWSRRPTGRMLLAAGAGVVLESAVGLAAASDDDTLPTSTATLTVPVGAFARPVDLLVSGRASAELPAGLPGGPTELGLEITAAAGTQEIHQFAPGHELILTIDYATADLAGADPANLKLLYWDESLGAWSIAGITTTPDPANQRLVARLEHLSRMRTASLSLTNQVYLPAVRR